MFLLRKIYAFFIDIIQSVLVACAIFLIIYIFLLRPFQVNGESMFPNFQDREYILTNLITLRFEKPKLGDVIVFQAPPDPSKDYIKRVIGVAGNTIELMNGDVYVNGQKLDESSFLKSDVKTYGGEFLKEGETITVPQGDYFVMGDNRPYSSDSRDWGFVSQNELIGESMLVYWPFNEWEVVHNPYSQ